ncbi:domain containing protein [Candidatus Micropelagos thuwalensis]|uniref:Domain containing protein n=1 Tax=Candidatus Micropelagius thuwalensis TaxID=1397666 RepID=U2XN90_9PROT|nr:tetratricopeptide repeat protein [Candidatus Micropelagos thuwalensis]ERL46597.1 domain containing protein [Candidatus Micropelagos thuwalensis]
MKPLLLATALLFSTPVWAAGGYGYEPSVSKLINDAKKLIKNDKYVRAIKKLKKAIQEEPDNSDIYNYLGFAHRKIGDYDKSKIYYEEALSIKPDHKLALEYQGELFLKLDDVGSAQSNLVKLRMLCPEGCDELTDLDIAISKYLSSQ